ncbi:MAG: fasciclin domain-containing protein [Candidatus Nanopelagicales bacterium]
MTTTTRRAGAAAALLALPLALAACGSSTGSAAGPMTTSAPAPSSSTAMASPSTDAMDPMGQVFGAACAAVPKDGPGSFDGMATAPVATAASNNPALSTLVTAVKKAGLVDSLNSADGITVFAPTNDAFAALDKATLDKALADPKGLLTTVLTYHVVPGMLAPADLPGEHETLQGGTLTVAGSGEDFTVNGSAKVVCGNVPTANATVYIIDGVLLPS